MKDRFNYWRRIFKVYFSKKPSYLTFWHEKPALSDKIISSELGAYYMTFADKAGYTGPRDGKGVILFDYYGDIGRQYNPLSVAQYGLGHYNLYLKTKDKKHLEIVKTQADWLVENLENNDFNIPVWKHKFRWRYKQYLTSGWYSAHSQGTGISLLARFYKETGDKIYLKTAEKAFMALNTLIKDGGVKCVDADGYIWLEEYIVNSPTHILNGFLWGLWGVWDYYLLTQDAKALDLFNQCIKTLRDNLFKYDIGFWSLYDLSKQTMKMISSNFYHDLHLIQLKVMFLLTNDNFFAFYNKKWENYKNKIIYRWFAFIYKVIFKLFYF